MTPSRLRSPIFRALALAVSTLAVSAAARAETLASPWVQGYNNKARLVAGTATNAVADKQARVFAGLEIVMPPGWKTYWRNPGEAGGVPPEFDWTGSENLKDPVVLYPAPHRFSDKSGLTIGYKEHVIFPVRFVAADPAKLVKIKLKATYGACKELCVPAEAELELTVPVEVAASQELSDVLASVPVAQKSASAGAPKLKNSRVEAPGNKPKLVLDVEDPGMTGGDAFVFSSDGIYLPLPKKISEANGEAVYEVDLSDDFKSLRGKSINLTLTGVKGHSDTLIEIPSQ